MKESTEGLLVRLSNNCACSTQIGVLKKRVTDRCYIGIFADIVLGVSLTCLLLVVTQDRRQDMIELCVAEFERLISLLDQLLHWLMGNPAGLKLNAPLNQALGRFFLYHIYLWQTYITFVQPTLYIAFNLLCALCVFGASMQLALLKDFIAIFCVHIFCFYIYAHRSSVPADDSSSDSVEIDIDDPDWLERSVGDVYTRKRPVFSRASRTSSANQYGSSTTLNAASVTLSWNDLNVYVRDKDGQPGRHILKGLTGAAMPGQLIALMGASGAGKSTFMNSLVQRNTRGLIITGEVYVNGQVIGRDITAIAAYVQQDDLFSGGLTVREHMIFQAMLRLPADMSYRDKIRRVDQVINELGLAKCRNTKIGIPGLIKGISGGEKKRLSFACEILRNPSLLFCDEPTTGLDSFMAESVVTIMQELAAQGKTVICTIHQPASEIYAMFDRVLFVAEGRTAFFGKSGAALSFFNGLGYHCPAVYNPADYIIEVLAVTAANQDEARERVTRVCDAFESSEHGSKLEGLVQQTLARRGPIDPLFDGSSRSIYRASRLVQFAATFYRACVFNFRNPSIALAKYIQRIVFGLFVGLLYINTENNQAGIQNINGAFFYILNQLIFPVVYSVVAIIPSEFAITSREHHDGLYTVGTYFLARIFSYLPVYGVDGAIMSAIAYYMVGFNPVPTAFFTIIFVGILVEMVAVALGTMLSCVTPTFAIALTLGGPILALFNITGGLFANIGAFPVYLSWLAYISPFRYAFEAMAIVQWIDVTDISCPPTPNIMSLALGPSDLPVTNLLTNETSMILDDGYLTSAMNMTRVPNCISNGRMVLDSLAFPADMMIVWRDCGLLFAEAVILNLIAYIGLWIRIYKLLQLQLAGLQSLFRLFRGRKYNPLRDRIDSTQFDEQQLFLGTLLFALLLFLLPTTLTYFVVFSSTMTTMIVTAGVFHITMYITFLSYFCFSAFVQTYFWLIETFILEKFDLRIPRVSAQHYNDYGPLQ